ncbi:Hypothetical protein Minf_1599 [Methylacidiphilum infernorum V4]|uniref:Uncharacterized protein n=1 Tax=Methylacidiphilum infernorum (isolate V4) TaxID=481448 RepID=B3DWF0_METI4|nr:Hypothetical protein Minf_1599 [Methylacidiphilum infernorum V4]
MPTFLVLDRDQLALIFLKDIGEHGIPSQIVHGFDNGLSLP